MKVSLACLAAVTVAAPEEKKFVNKSKFMTSEPPKWWNKIPAVPDRFEWNQDNTDKLFSIHFAGKPASVHLKKSFEDLLEDAIRIKSSCSSGRKRRAFSNDDEQEDDYDEDSYEDEEGDPMADTNGDIATRKVVGNIKKDIKKYTLNIARWIKYEVYDLGGECEFLGHKMLARTDRLRWYAHYAYCKQVDESQSFCKGYYDKFDGVHPREHGKPLKKFPAPERPSHL